MADSVEKRLEALRALLPKGYVIVPKTRPTREAKGYHRKWVEPRPLPPEYVEWDDTVRLPFAGKVPRMLKGAPDDAA